MGSTMRGTPHVMPGVAAPDWAELTTPGASAVTANRPNATKTFFIP